MLQNVVSGTPNLANVLNLYCQTRKAAGQSIKISLGEHVALLASQAQVYDYAKTCTCRNCCQSAAAHVLVREGQEYETNVHDFDEEGNVEDKLDNIWETNVMNQQDPKTGHCLGNKNDNKSTGFKKGQNQKSQVNEMQGTHSRAYMDRDTWNLLEESDKKAWDGLLDKAKTKIMGHHFNKGKDYASQGSAVNKVEAKEHDLIFDESDDEEEEQIEVNKYTKEFSNSLTVRTKPRRRN